MLGLLAPALIYRPSCILRTGAEQFSAYTGYAFGLKFDGDFVDKTPRDPFDRVAVAVFAALRLLASIIDAPLHVDEDHWYRCVGLFPRVQTIWRRRNSS